MRKPFVAGNWKMNLDQAGATALVNDLLAKNFDDSVEVGICPPFVYALTVGSQLGGSNIGLGCQDVYFEPKGAFTGEISCAMLNDIGCSYVILGHSERRHVMGETDPIVNKKVKSAIQSGLTPIVCVGETLDERENGQTMKVITQQFQGSFAGISAEEMDKVVIAYEPVWAIGTGKVATPDQAEEVHSDLRKLMETSYNSEVAEKIRIQYGGSVKPDNAAELLSQPNIDGALVGGASLKADDFAAIISAAKP